MDTSAIGRNALGVGISGLAALILSFLPWYLTWSWDDEFFGSGSEGVNAWQSYATFGILLVVLAVGLVVVDVFFGAAIPGKVPLNLIAAAVAALGTLLLVLRALTWSSSIGFGSFGPGWSAYALWVAGVGVAVFAALRSRESGEKVDAAQLKNLANQAGQPARADRGYGVPHQDHGHPAPQAHQGQPHDGAAQYGEPQYGQAQHGQPQHGQQQYGEPQYGRPHHGPAQAGYGQRPYGQPPAPEPYTQQFGQPGPGRPGFAPQPPTRPQTGHFSTEARIGRYSPQQMLSQQGYHQTGSGYGGHHPFR